MATKPLDRDVVAAMQRALAAEHAAVWVYGLVKALLPPAYQRAVDRDAAAHRALRDTLDRLLHDAAVTPRPTEPSYHLPQPVIDEKSAAAVVAAAESDCTIGWHGLLERTDDRGLRRTALEGLTGSAVRETAWRRTAGLSPVAIALPGMSDAR